jgi:hypothetical protein
MVANKSSNATPIIVAIIGALAVIVVGYWQFVRKPAPEAAELTYAGRVLDTSSEQPIRKAKVTLEIRGAPPVVYTDSEGVYSFKLTIKSGETVEGRIRIVAEGYENFDRNISILTTTRLEDVRLTPVKKRPASAPRSPPGSPANKLAFAVGAAVAMLGRSSYETGRTIFERSLSDFGVPRSQLQDLTNEYRSVDRSMRTATPKPADRSEAAEKQLLTSAQEQLRVLGGEKAAQHVDFGYGLCRLALRLKFWVSSSDQVQALAAAQSELAGLQRSSESLGIPNPLRHQINGLQPSGLDSVEGREAVARVLADTLKHFDMEPGPPASTKARHGKD